MLLLCDLRQPLRCRLIREARVQQQADLFEAEPGSEHQPYHAFQGSPRWNLSCHNQTTGGAQMATPSGRSAERMDPASAMGGTWRTRWAAPPRTDYTSETKPFFLTSEFLVLVLLLMGLGIGASTTSDVDSRLFWILATVAASFYMLSRGIAKAGTRSRAWDPREDLDLGQREQR